MGKYLRKSKTTKGEISLLELTHHTQSSTLGVRTRAKTLALQKSGGGGDGDGGSYLQLRSRRLEKPQQVKRQKHPLKHPNLPPVVKKSQSCSRTRQQGQSCNSEKKEETQKGENCSCEGGAIEASFGENLLEFDARERTTRESTPCSLMRDPDNIQTPGSSTKPTSASGANSRAPDSTRKHIPAAHEMNDFFAVPEEQQQKQFIEKYNFDPVNEKPLPGRYEWVKVDP